ncbi:hypothetical protein DY000_02056559 [Brassica cretica]|uniref:CCR4-NOT transcription complex subunit 10 n=1 Tax=Brassica cretica TaxID=69181 RepID=A0ABQ7AN56_BRACR|nr:hypothetical protein DY000_02056559 [Brassica cretica]
MASYVFNNYYLKNGQADEACSFYNNAALTSINPNFGIILKLVEIVSLLIKRVSNGRVVDDTSVGAGGQADMSSSRRVSSS